MTGNKPWWKDGLLFSCLGCGRCCRGEPGAVLVSPEEAALISGMVQMPVAAFARAALFQGKKILSLRERPNGECVFYERAAARCGVYEFRPLQCRLFPFWPSILESRDAWEREKGRCPGVGSGTWHPRESIDAFLALAPHPGL